MPFRAFVGVPVPAGAPLRGMLDALRGLRADLKVVPAENLHLTVSFLGQVPDDAAVRAERAIPRACAGAPRFSLRVRGVGAFPNARRPRVVWAGLDSPEPLEALAGRVRAELAREGLAGDDKPFRSHVTLARAREGGSVADLPPWLAAHAGDELGVLAVDEVCLYRSHLSPQGPTYEPIVRAPLGVA